MSGMTKEGRFRMTEENVNAHFSGVTDTSTSELLVMSERERAETIIDVPARNRQWRWHQVIDAAWPCSMTCDFCKRHSAVGDIVLVKVFKVITTNGIPLDVTLLFHQECFCEIADDAPDSSFDKIREQLLAGEDVLGINR